MKLGFFSQLDPKPDEDAGLLIQFEPNGGAFLAVMKKSANKKPCAVLRLTRKQCLTLSRMLEEASRDADKNEWEPEE